VFRKVWRLLAAAAAAVTAASVAKRRRARAGPPAPPAYTVTPGQEYGPRWRNRRPPGLPRDAALCGAEGSALPEAARLAREAGLGEQFAGVVLNLAKRESHGGRYGCPADTFDSRCSRNSRNRCAELCTCVQGDGERNPADNLITAWGPFNFNRDAWRSAGVDSFGIAPVAQSSGGVPIGDAFPWNASPHEQVAIPVAIYRQAWGRVRGRRGSTRDAARAVRLWHKNPTLYLRYVQDGPRKGWRQAWEDVPDAPRRTIDRHLRSVAGLT